MLTEYQTLNWVMEYEGTFSSRGDCLLQKIV